MSQPHQNFKTHTICFYRGRKGGNFFWLITQGSQVQTQEALVITQWIGPNSKAKTMIVNFIYTPPKFNIAPEEWCLEDYFPLGKGYFQGLC